MNWKRAYKLARGYTFLARNKAAGIVVNKALELLAFLDYRLLILLSMWHPDMQTRLKLIRKRGVNIEGDHVWVDLGVWIEVTTPTAVTIEDYAKIAWGAIIFAHDAAANSMIDLPMRVLPTRIGYNSAIGAHSIIMPGVQVGKHCGVLPGSVVTKDVPDYTIVGGNPAVQLMTDEQVIEAWQEDAKARPEVYYDLPNHPHRPPSTPLDHMIKWREWNLPLKKASQIRTHTPFDYLIEAAELKEK